MTSCSPWRASTIVEPTWPAPMTKIFTAGAGYTSRGTRVRPVSGTVGRMRRLTAVAAAARSSCSSSPRAPPRPGSASAALRLVQVADGLQAPVHVTAPPGARAACCTSSSRAGSSASSRAGRSRRSRSSTCARTRAGGRRAGPARARVRPRLRDEPAVRRQLHGSERRHARRPLPLRRHEGAAGERQAAALRQPAVLEPQRRHGGVRQGRPRLRRHGRRRLGRRPREPGAEPGLAARQDPPPRSGAPRRRSP